MDKPSDNHIKNRKTTQPSFVSSQEDIYSVKISRYGFYPEDIKKMQTMTPQEARKYRARLVREGKTYDIESNK
jgi:hypothetical protein